MCYLSVCEAAWGTETMDTPAFSIIEVWNDQRILTAFLKKTYRRGNAPENSLGYGMELHVPIKSMVPIAHSSSAKQCCLQKPGSKTEKKETYWNYSLKWITVSDVILWDFFCISWFHRFRGLIWTCLSSSHGLFLSSLLDLHNWGGNKWWWKHRNSLKCVFFCKVGCWDRDIW